MKEFFLIPCVIERGGFSSERTFEIETPDGGKLVGTANIEYLRQADKQELDDDTPGYGDKLDGYVMCRKIRELDQGNVVVEVPSSDLIHVPLNDLLTIDQPYLQAAVMYLSDRDLAWAIETGDLIITPKPTKYGPTSVDLHLGPIGEAKVWDIEKYLDDEGGRGRPRPELFVGKYNLPQFSKDYLHEPPEYECDDQLVGRRGNQIVVKNGGFLLWQTEEKVGTPDANADLICFVDGKSTKARTEQQYT